MRELMMKALKGDGPSYAVLLERIAVMVRARLKRSSRLSPERIEDLVQDVLLVVHTKRDTYRTDLPLMPWLQTITRYKLIDSLRAASREPAMGELNDEADQIFFSGGPQTDADDFANRNDVEIMLADLPEKQREVLRLAKIEDVPLKEIGARLNMSLANVKVTVHRALAFLRKKQGIAAPKDVEDE